MNPLDQLRKLDAERAEQRLGWEAVRDAAERKAFTVGPLRLLADSTIKALVDDLLERDTLAHQLLPLAEALEGSRGAIMAYVTCNTNDIEDVRRVSVVGRAALDAIDEALANLAKDIEEVSQ